MVEKNVSGYWPQFCKKNMPSCRVEFLRQWNALLATWRHSEWNITFISRKDKNETATFVQYWLRVTVPHSVCNLCFSGREQ